MGGDIAEVAGGFSGWQVEVRKRCRGMLLSTQKVADGKLTLLQLPS